MQNTQNQKRFEDDPFSRYLTSMWVQDIPDLQKFLTKTFTENPSAKVVIFPNDKRVYREDWEKGIALPPPTEEKPMETNQNKSSKNHFMIKVKKSPTADTRTCDFANTPKHVLLDSSLKHIADVGMALAFFNSKLMEAATKHDYDKLSMIDWFHSDFLTGFKQTGWWDNHRRIHRHHLNMADGVPDDVNLIDLIEYVSDCVMAGMARSGSVYEIKIDDAVLKKAFNNTVELLKKQVVVDES